MFRVIVAAECLEGMANKVEQQAELGFGKADVLVCNRGAVLVLVDLRPFISINFRSRMPDSRSAVFTCARITSEETGFMR